MGMTDLERRRAARVAALKRMPDLAQHIAPRKPVQRFLDGRPEAFSRAVVIRRPRLGPPQDQA